MTISWARCSQCREYDFLDRHHCKPIWECRPEWEKDDYWAEVHAFDAEEAAEKYAESYDCDGGEYSIVGGRFREEVIVQVRALDKEEFQRFAIQAEAVPTYHATLLSQERDHG